MERRYIFKSLFPLSGSWSLAFQMKKNEFIKYRARILSLIKSGPGVVTTTEVSEEFEMSWNTAEKYLLELALENQVQRIKKAGVNLWVIRK